MPIWTTWIVRIATRRPLLHRLGGRTVLIGDVPWVAQVRTQTKALSFAAFFLAKLEYTLVPCLERHQARFSLVDG
eukprot:4220075-Pleurochrysis_carterae.AAC.1